MRRLKFADEQPRNSALPVEDGIHDAVHPRHLRRFEHVFGDRIAVKHAYAHIGVEPVLGGVQVDGVVVRDGARGREPRDNRFAPAAEPAEIVEDHCASDNDTIALHCHASEFNARAARGRADVDVARIVVRFADECAIPEPFVDRRAENRALLLGRRYLVRPTGKDEPDVLVADSRTVQLGNQRRQIPIHGSLPVGVRQDQRDGLAAPKPVEERLVESDGTLQIVAQLSVNVIQRGRVGNIDRTETRAPVQFRRQRARPIGEFNRGHVVILPAICSIPARHCGGMWKMNNIGRVSVGLPSRATPLLSSTM